MLNSGVCPLVRSSCEPTENTAEGGERLATACARTVGRLLFWLKNGSTLRSATTFTASRGFSASMVVLKRSPLHAAFQLPHWIATVPPNRFWVTALKRAALFSALLAAHRSMRCAPASAARSATFCASRFAQNT
ncbi:MAG: hypothetical protein GAK31_00049 [Stenotrophomonas maltophilia]|uniref:Uncharacterized protein n=1 Tax=Stenotrophomonas maltophilia TaxID=40324 RepID=A0A7V8FIQ7_STEMA|nr:MAG: hypothetical protein GAK31_00049 [Stenotrophomonas maltophilia]